MNVIVMTLLTAAVGVARADLLRTVYCRSLCNDYLRVQESDMPLCSEEHLDMNQCGTVISCSWADVELEKHRRTANTSDIICCYQVAIKEKGDCDLQTNAAAVGQQVLGDVSSRSECPNAQALYFIITLLAFLVFVMTFYIGWTLIFAGPTRFDKSPRYASGDAAACRPMVATRPLHEMHLLGSVAVRP